MSKIDIDNIIQTMEHQFSEGFAFLKNKRVHKDEHDMSLNEANWFLMMGSKNAGKTTLLANSELPFLLSKKDPKNTKAFENNWWVTRDAVILDIPADYLSSKYAKVWRAFLRLLKRHSYQKCLDGIFVVLSLKELQASRNHRALAKTLGKRLRAIQGRFKTEIPVTFIFNKFDGLSGFNDFFHNLHKHERQQHWGINFSDSRTLAQQVKTQFADLVQQLRSQLIWRMQQQVNQEQRQNILDFPDEVAELAPVLTHFFQEVQKSIPKRFICNGVYFCSAMNQSKAKVLVQEGFINYNKGGRAYFIHDILAHTLRESTTGREQRNHTNLILIAAACVGFVVLIAFVLAIIVGKRERNLQVASQALSSYQAQQQQSQQLLGNTKIKALQTANQALSSGLSLAQPNNVAQQLAHSYQDTLAGITLPKIQTVLAKGAIDSKLPVILRYQALYAYLTLANPKSIDANYIAAIISQVAAAESMSASLPDSKTLQGLVSELAQQKVAINVDNDFVKSVRQDLAQVDPGELALVIFASDPQYQQRLTVDFSENSLTRLLFAYKENNPGIPALYTATAANNLNDKALNQYINQATTGNAVLGSLTPTNAGSSTALKVFMQDYMQAYNKAWIDYLNNITVLKANDLAQLDQQLSSLTTSDSPLLALLNLIKLNLPDNIRLQPELLALKSITTSTAYMNHLNSSIAQLQQLIHGIATSKQPQLAAFNIAKQRFYQTGNTEDAITAMYNLADQSPAPVKQWLTMLANDSWQMLLDSASHYINQKYQQIVYQPFADVISNNYPFNPQANSDISLDNFNRLFNNDGILDHFFEQYLKPFINTNQLPWQAVSKDGESLNISNNVLGVFMRAQKLQTAFFQNQSFDPFVRFSVQPTSQDQQIKEIDIALGQQKVQFVSSGDLAQQYISWPNPADKLSASIIFIDGDKKVHQFSATGPWALLKILQQASVKKDPAVPHNWIVSFTDPTNGDDDQATSSTPMQLQLNFAPHQNPFQMDTFENFKLPQDIFQ